MGQLPNGNVIASGDDGIDGSGVYALGIDGGVNLGYGVYNIETGRQGVFDANNNVLDGNGDGIAGDSFRQRVTTATAGDIDLNGRVNFDDFLLFIEHFGRNHARWEHGDFDGDRVVGFSDFFVLSGNFEADSEE